MSSITYLRATPADLERVVDQRLEVLAIFQGEHPAGEVEALRVQLRATIDEDLRSHTYICWLAAADGKIIGSGGMSIRRQPGNFTNPGGRTGYIMSMYTQPQYRNRGVCSEIVQRLVQSGSEMGIDHFELHATKAGEPVYQKLGFVLHPEPTYRMDRTASIGRSSESR